MAEQHTFLAFDCGATSGRAVLGSFEGGTFSMEEVYRFPNQTLAIGGRIYWDVYTLYGQLLACPDAYLSVAMFYTTLLPLATANEAEMIDGMYAFAKCTGWSCFDRVNYGYISPCSVLEVTGLLPEPGNADDWIRLAESEAGYFGAIVDTLIEGRIFFRPPVNASPLDDPELFLHGMHGRLKHRVLDRIQAHLAETVAYLRGNGQKPDVDYLRRDVVYENLLLND